MARGNWRKHGSGDICAAIPDGTRTGLIARCKQLYAIVCMFRDADTEDAYADAMNLARGVDVDEYFYTWLKQEAQP